MNTDNLFYKGITDLKNKKYPCPYKKFIGGYTLNDRNNGEMFYLSPNEQYCILIKEPHILYELMWIEEERSCAVIDQVGYFSGIGTFEDWSNCHNIRNGLLFGDFVFHRKPRGAKRVYLDDISSTKIPNKITDICIQIFRKGYTNGEDFARYYERNHRQKPIINLNRTFGAPSKDKSPIINGICYSSGAYFTMNCYGADDEDDD